MVGYLEPLQSAVIINNYLPSAQFFQGSFPYTDLLNPCTLESSHLAWKSAPLLTSYDAVNRMIIPFLQNSDNISYIIELFVLKYDNTGKVLSTVLET